MAVWSARSRSSLRSRWAPCDGATGPGQGQFPEGSIRPGIYGSLTPQTASPNQSNPRRTNPPALTRAMVNQIATPPPMVRLSTCVVFRAVGRGVPALGDRGLRRPGAFRCHRADVANDSSSLFRDRGTLGASSISSHTVSGRHHDQRASPISPNLPRSVPIRDSRLSASFRSCTPALPRRPPGIAGR